MSQMQIDQWLDGELDFEGMMELENWLRKDPLHLQSFADQVQFNEKLHACFGKHDIKHVTVPFRARRIWPLALVAMAATVLIAFGMIFYFGSARSTIDPQLVVLTGDPRVEIVRSNPDPAPIPIAPSDLPLDTLVKTAEKSCVVRWIDNYEIELDSSTTLRLRSSDVGEDDESSLSRIVLDEGRVRVKIVAVAKAIDLLANGSRVRVTVPTEFTLASAVLAPGPGVNELTVTEGFVDLQDRDGVLLRLEAGETITLP